jgi:hypothetical protein
MYVWKPEERVILLDGACLTMKNLTPSEVGEFSSNISFQSPTNMETKFTL